MYPVDSRYSLTRKLHKTRTNLFSIHLSPSNLITRPLPFFQRPPFAPSPPPLPPPPLLSSHRLNETWEKKDDLQVVFDFDVSSFSLFA